MANDFRGYIQQVAPEFLGYVGNDGGINTAKLNAAGGVESNYKQQSLNTTGAANAIKELYGKFNAGAGNSTANSTAALLAQIAALSRTPQQVYAPSLDFAGISAKARAAAENSVTPYYTKQLSDFLAQQAAQRSQSEVAATSNIAQLEESLKNTLEGNTITGQRTTQDVATNEAQIAQQADQAQTDTGQQFATDRITQARELAKAGLTGGLGAQQAEGAQIARNATEKRAGEATDQAHQQQELFKARTFEDLARSGTLATSAKETGVKQVNVDLSNFIQNQGLDLTAKQTQLSTQKEADILAKQRAEEGNLVQNFINSIANPAQRQAALQAYGGLL